jgi:16S rRNA (cytidine1402-2'-O)-methyltransferase
MSGTLFVVGTHIGNLEDITLRALRTLRDVDLIAAEDTRRTSKLLAHYDIRRPLISVREHNESAVAPRLVARLVAGESVALVSDAGTPGISDPGARLVRAARDAGVKVVPIPGASAVVTALSVAGIAGHAHMFLGFPPSSGQARVEWFERVAAEPGVVVCFESPHRVARTLEDLSIYGSNRIIIVARELTKINEELVIYTIGKVAVRAQGELTIIIGPRSEPLNVSRDEPALITMVGQLTDSGLFSSDEALAIAAKFFNFPERVARKVVKKALILVKRQNESAP